MCHICLHDRRRATDGRSDEMQSCWVVALYGIDGVIDENVQHTGRAIWNAEYGVDEIGVVNSRGQVAEAVGEDSRQRSG